MLTTILNLKIYSLLLVLLLFFIGCDKESQQKQTDQQRRADTIKTQLTTSKDTAQKTFTGTGDIMKIETNKGIIKIKLFPDKAPKTVARIKELVNEGFYNGIIFHRVIDGFMIQGGDPTGTGTRGSGQTIPDEFNNGLKHDSKGVVAMANTGRPNSQDSQFYITLAPQPHLDGKYTIFGKVINGMEVVEKIGKVKTDARDKPLEEIKMIKVTLEEE
ncbi:MAG: peptidylprolyl isomerase [Ignavibacteria bacterium]